MDHFTPQLVKFAITMMDGSLQVMSFVTVGRGNRLPWGASWIDSENGLWRRHPTDENVRYEILKTFEDHPEQPQKWRMVDAALIPEDRTFRGAWEDDGEKIIHNMEKAREIHRERIHYARQGKIKELDVAYQRADEDGNPDGKRAVVAKKQILRNLPDATEIRNAKTPEDLKAFWPEDLLGPQPIGLRVELK